MKGIYCGTCHQFMPKNQVKGPTKNLSRCNYCGRRVPRAMRTPRYEREWKENDERFRTEGQGAAV